MFIYLSQNVSPLPRDSQGISLKAVKVVPSIVWTRVAPRGAVSLEWVVSDNFQIARHFK